MIFSDFQFKISTSNSLYVTHKSYKTARKHFQVSSGLYTSIFVIFESISDGLCDEKINGKRKRTKFSFKERAFKFQYQTAESYFVFPQTFPTEYFPLLVFLYFQLNARMIFHLSLFFISDIQIYFYFLSKRRNS